MIKHTVDMALDLTEPELDVVPCDGWWASYILHSVRSGHLRDIVFSETMQQKIVHRDVTARRGDIVEPFIGSNHGLGSLILRFDSRDEMLELMDNMERYIDVQVD
jgi:hypothetical protein